MLRSSSLAFSNRGLVVRVRVRRLGVRVRDGLGLGLGVGLGLELGVELNVSLLGVYCVESWICTEWNCQS
jgi:hypothetical protein